jgi:N-acetylmuramoyl-L-alanine amidase
MRMSPLMAFTALFMTFATLSKPALALDVNAIRFGHYPDKTRIVLDLSEKADFRAFAIAGPDRLVIDLPSYQWQAGESNLKAVPNVSSLRQGPLDQQLNRIVLDLTHPIEIISAFVLPANGGLPDRLVVDYKKSAATNAQKIYGALNDNGSHSGKQAQASSPTGKTNEASAAQAYQDPMNGAYQPSQQEVAQYSLSKLSAPNAPRAPSAPSEPSSNKSLGSDQVSSESMQSAVYKKPNLPPLEEVHEDIPEKKAIATNVKRTIVIDAGHGGADPGAIGANGIFEKNITLSMAQELKKELEATGQYNVHLTRNDDRFLRLRDRVNVARNKSADLFISLHADSIGKSDVSGASIYTLSETASDKETAALADRENKADLIAGADLSHVDHDIAQILVGMSMRDNMNQSKFFANNLVDNMQNGGVKTLERPHRYAGFAVLKAPDVPSVLIEIGFMSNANEVKRLNDPKYRARLSNSIRRSIDAYFEKVK